MEAAGEKFLLFLLLCKCFCSYASLSCGIYCDIQYKSEQTVCRIMKITDPFLWHFFSFLVSCADVAGFCSPQWMLTELLLYSMRTFTVCVWFDFAGIPLWFQSPCEFFKNDYFQHLPGFHSYTNYLTQIKDYTKFMLFFSVETFKVWWLRGKKTQNI